MPGPLPKPDAERQRRNAPSIPTTNLPAEGYSGPVPAVPDLIELGEAGRAWWDWAWSTPHAAAWSAGEVYVAARRAQLEDDMAALDDVDADIDWAELLGLDDESSAAKRLDSLIMRLRRQAGGKAAMSKAATELEDRLGLSPKAFAQLRWRIVPTEDKPETEAKPKKRTLKAV